MCALMIGVCGCTDALDGVISFLSLSQRVTQYEPSRYYFSSVCPSVCLSVRAKIEKKTTNKKLKELGSNVLW